jgi:hypothetical protein
VVEDGVNDSEDMVDELQNEAGSGNTKSMSGWKLDDEDQFARTETWFGTLVVAAGLE